MDAQKCVCFVVLNLIGLSGLCLGQRFPYAAKVAHDGHSCSVCPTYFQKVCAFDARRNETYIFDNHCIMDLHNCIEDTDFQPIKYTKCIYFGNFGYVYGLKKEDEDYDDRHVIYEQSVKNPYFV